MRRHPLPTALVLALVGATALAGCGGGSSTAHSSDGSSSSGPATGSASGSASASASASTSTSAVSPSGSASGSSPGSSPDTTVSAEPTLPRDRLSAASYHKAVLASSAASGAEEQAVVAAWMTFWEGTADTFFNSQPDAQFDRVARGKARADILDYLAKQQHKHQRVVGWAKDNVTSVSVHGDRATVRDCTENFTFTVDQEGEPLSNPDPWYAVTGTLEKQQGQWVVVDQVSKTPKTSCLS